MGQNEPAFELVKCERCGVQWTPRMTDHEGNDLGERPPHECPQPYAPGVAQALHDFYVSSQIPVHPRGAAAIRLGMEA